MLLRSPQKMSRAVPNLLLSLWLVLSFVGSNGCTTKKVIRFHDPAHSLNRFAGTVRPVERHISERTQKTLRAYGLDKALKDDLAYVLKELRQHNDSRPSPGLLYAIAEIAYSEARHLDLRRPDQSLQYDWLCCYHAFGYLFDPRFQRDRNYYDPNYREVCVWYNKSTEQILRRFGDGRSVEWDSGTVRTIATADDGERNLLCHRFQDRARNDVWEPLRFAADYEVKALENSVRQFGFGVPLLGKRKTKIGEMPTNKYSPSALTFPVTAFLRILPPGQYDNRGRPLHAVIELHDPLKTTEVVVGNQTIPLESDLTTPIACSIADPRMAQIHNVGLLRSDIMTKPFAELLQSPRILKRLDSEEKEAIVKAVENGEFGERTLQGLYLMQPYENGRIPIIFVHGLWSSPLTWMEMVNSLQSDREIRSKYQFLFYFYPTGQPFWISAAAFRRDLAEFHHYFDPEKQDPAFDNMILIGHSMGGLVSQLQTFDSGMDLWRLVSDRPSGEVLASDKIQERSAKEIQDWFFFQANPSIKRVICIATPNHGSRASNEISQRLGSKAIKLSENILETVTLFAKNESDHMKPDSLLRLETSIDSLSPENPIFDVMRDKRKTSRVRYHNIIGLREQNILTQKMLSPSDGVVSAESARMSECESETVVSSPHTKVHSHPGAILEVQRILIEHLNESGI